MRLDHLLSKEQLARLLRRPRPEPFLGRTSRDGSSLWSTGYLVSSSAKSVSTSSGTEGCRRWRSGLARCWVLRERAKAIPYRTGTPLPRMRHCALRYRPYLENCTVDASINCSRQVNKGTRWMPWHQEPKKDVGACDKPREVGNQTLIRGFPNRETCRA